MGTLRDWSMQYLKQVDGKPFTQPYIKCTEEIEQKKKEYAGSCKFSRISTVKSLGRHILLTHKQEHWN